MYRVIGGVESGKKVKPAYFMKEYTVHSSFTSNCMLTCRFDGQFCYRSMFPNQNSTVSINSLRLQAGTVEHRPYSLLTGLSRKSAHR